MTALAAGATHSLAIDDCGRVWSWGGNEFGQLGRPSKDPKTCAVPSVVPMSSRARDVAAGWAHSAVVTTDGDLLTFGWGLYHQLGHGSTQNERSARLVQALEGVDVLSTQGSSGVVQVACGNWHTTGMSSLNCLKREGTDLCDQYEQLMETSTPLAGAKMGNWDTLIQHPKLFREWCPRSIATLTSRTKATRLWPSRVDPVRLLCSARTETCTGGALHMPSRRPQAAAPMHGDDCLLRSRARASQAEALICCCWQWTEPRSKVAIEMESMCDCTCL